MGCMHAANDPRVMFLDDNSYIIYFLSSPPWARPISSLLPCAAVLLGMAGYLVPRRLVSAGLDVDEGK